MTDTAREAAPADILHPRGECDSCDDLRVRLADLHDDVTGRPAYTLDRQLEPEAPAGTVRAHVCSRCGERDAVVYPPAMCGECGGLEVRP